MKTFRVAVLAGLMVLAFFSDPHVARAQNERDCAWPLLMSPEGTANFQLPDAAARYWIMPFEKQYETMTVKGTYPNARYFSFTAYETVVGGFKLPPEHLFDAQIAPDPGGINPFISSGGHGGTYTVVISRSGTSSGNTIAVSRNNLVYVLLRMYVADADPHLRGQHLMGGVPLPAITLTDATTGANRQVVACSPINKWLDLSEFVQVLFPPMFDVNIDQGTPSSDRLWFAAPAAPPSILWPNPDGKYMMMWPGAKYQPGRIIVIRGKAPGFPDTFDGSPVWVPSRGFRSVDLRYWATCIGDFAPPMSVVGCATDLTTRLEHDYYTIVISDDRQRPDWLRPNVNWLPWGDEQYPKVVVLRNMLPAATFPYSVEAAWASCAFDFSLSSPPDRSVLDGKGPCSQDAMGDYYPVAVWCDKAEFVAGGWEACLQRHPHRGHR